MTNSLKLLFLLPIILLTMMMHNMNIVMKRREGAEEEKEEEPTKFVGRFSDYGMIMETLPEHELKLGSGISFLLWGFSIMTLGPGAVLLWCSGSAILHWLIPDNDEPRGGRGHFYK
jgi:hypothetical protein